MSEYRTIFRYRTHRSAKLFLNGGGIIDCLVRDLSKKGVGLEVADPKRVPNEFVITIQGMADKNRCRVAWRNGNMIGVEFLQ